MDSDTGDPQRRRGSVLLRLLRAPNLLSVPGDPLAGCFLAAAASSYSVAFPSVVAAAAASVAAYAGGMVDNDLVDLERDRLERPERPLPSGDIGISTAHRLRIVLLALPFLLGFAAKLPIAWFAVHGALLVAILTYNRTKEHSRILGVLLMGLCRGLSLLSGAALCGATALTDRTVLVAFAVWTIYVAGLTAFASTENVRGSGGIRYLMLLPFAALLLAAVPLQVGAVAGAALVWDALRDAGPQAPPPVVRRTVGRLIRVLLPMQACTCLASPDGALPALFLVACWFVSARLARRYAAS